MISVKTLHKLLVCDPATGTLTWRKRPVDMFEHCKNPLGVYCSWNTRFAGKPALATDGGNGYLRGEIFKRTYRAHRVVWAMTNGAWPSDQIDHINGVETDNRIINLREVTNEVNGKNQKRPSSNTSGHVGVNWSNCHRKYVAKIRVNGKYIHLGYFTDIDKAAAVRKAAEIEHGFHPNHGRR